MNLTNFPPKMHHPPSATSPSLVSVSKQHQHHPPLRSSKSLEGVGFEKAVSPEINGLACHPSYSSSSPSFGPYSHHAHSHSQPLSPSYPLPLFYQHPPPRSELRLNKPLPPKPLAVETALESSDSASTTSSTTSIQIQLQQDQDMDTAASTTMSQFQACSPTTTASATTAKDSASSTIDSYYYGCGRSREGLYGEFWDLDRKSSRTRSWSQSSDSAVVFESVDIGIERPQEELSHQHQLQPQPQNQQPLQPEVKRINTIDEWSPSSGEETLVYPPVTEDSDDDDDDDEEEEEEEEVERELQRIKRNNNRNNGNGHSSEREEKAKSDLALKAFVSEAIYGPQSHYIPPTRQIPNKLGTSHYFRDKKWDFFPELASPSGLQLASTTATTSSSPSTLKSQTMSVADRYKRKTTDLYRGTFKETVLGVRDSFRLLGGHRRVSKETVGLGSTSTSAGSSPLANTSNESGDGNLDVNEYGEWDLVKRPSSPMSTTTTTTMTATMAPTPPPAAAAEKADTVMTGSLPALRYEPHPSTFYDACSVSDKESKTLPEDKYEYEHQHSNVDLDSDHDHDGDDGHEINIYMRNTEALELTAASYESNPESNPNEGKDNYEEEEEEEQEQEHKAAKEKEEKTLTLSAIHKRTPTSTSRQTQLAVPLSSYQKYGPAIWETPKTSHKKRRHNNRVRFTTRHHRKSSSASSQSLSSTTESYSTKASSIYPNITATTTTTGTGAGGNYVKLTPPPKSPLRARSTNTKANNSTNVNTNKNPNPNTNPNKKDRGGRKASQMLGEAKKIITESKADRRREELKAQIKFVGPLNPLSFEKKHQWV